MKWIRTLTSWTLFLAVIVVFIALNVFAGFFYYRFDLTDSQIFSLSDGTKDILKNLDDVVNVKLYFSSQLPPNLSILVQEVQDMVAEYKRYGGNSFVVSMIDPNSEELKKEALGHGIPEIQMNVYQKDKIEVQNGFLGMVFLYKDRKEIIPVIQNTANLEYEFTSQLRKVLSAKQPTVGFLTGHGEHSFPEFEFIAPQENDDYNILRQAIEKNYRVHKVDLSASREITSTDVLIVAGPKTSLTVSELYKIDQYLMSGGKVVFLIDRVKIENGLQARELTTGIEPLIESYGVKLPSGILKDVRHENGAFRSTFVQYIIPYPFFPVFQKENFSSSEPMMRSLNSIVLQWAGPLEIPSPSDTIQILMTTSSSGSIASPPYNLDPQQNWEYPEAKSIPAAVVIRGPVQSFFRGKSLPKLSVDEIKQGIQVSSQKRRDLSEKESAMILIGNSTFLSDGSLRDWPQNLEFALNFIDSLALDDSLIAIRAKISRSQPIRELSFSAQQYLKYSVIFAIPVFVTIFGVWHLWSRRRRSQRGSFGR